MSIFLKTLRWSIALAACAVVLGSLVHPKLKTGRYAISQIAAERASPTEDSVLHVIATDGREWVILVSCAAVQIEVANVDRAYIILEKPFPSELERWHEARNAKIIVPPDRKVQWDKILSDAQSLPLYGQQEIVLP